MNSDQIAEENVKSCITLLDEYVTTVVPDQYKRYFTNPMAAISAFIAYPSASDDFLKRLSDSTTCKSLCTVLPKFDTFENWRVEFERIYDHFMSSSNANSLCKGEEEEKSFLNLLKSLTDYANDQKLSQTRDALLNPKFNCDDIMRLTVTNNRMLSTSVMNYSKEVTSNNTTLLKYIMEQNNYLLKRFQPLQATTAVASQPPDPPPPPSSPSSPPIPPRNTFPPPTPPTLPPHPPSSPSVSTQSSSLKSIQTIFTPRGQNKYKRFGIKVKTVKQKKGRLRNIVKSTTDTMDTIDEQSTFNPEPRNLILTNLVGSTIDTTTTTNNEGVSTQGETSMNVDNSDFLISFADDNEQQMSEEIPLSQIQSTATIPTPITATIIPNTGYLAPTTFNTALPPIQSAVPIIANANPSLPTAAITPLTNVRFNTPIPQSQVSARSDYDASTILPDTSNILTGTSTVFSEAGTSSGFSGILPETFSGMHEMVTQNFLSSAAASSITNPSSISTNINNTSDKITVTDSTLSDYNADTVINPNIGAVLDNVTFVNTSDASQNPSEIINVIDNLGPYAENEILDQENDAGTLSSPPNYAYAQPAMIPMNKYLKDLDKAINPNDFEENPEPSTSSSTFFPTAPYSSVSEIPISTRRVKKLVRRKSKIEEEDEDEGEKKVPSIRNRSRSRSPSEKNNRRIEENTVISYTNIENDDSNTIVINDTEDEDADDFLDAEENDSNIDSISMIMDSSNDSSPSLEGVQISTNTNLALPTIIDITSSSTTPASSFTAASSSTATTSTTVAAASTPIINDTKLNKIAIDCIKQRDQQCTNVNALPFPIKNLTDKSITKFPTCYTRRKNFFLPPRGGVFDYEDIVPIILESADALVDYFYNVPPMFNKTLKLVPYDIEISIQAWINIRDTNRYDTAFVDIEFPPGGRFKRDWFKMYWMYTINKLDTHISETVEDAIRNDLYSPSAYVVPNLYYDNNILSIGSERTPLIYVGVGAEAFDDFITGNKIEETPEIFNPSNYMIMKSRILVSLVFTYMKSNKHYFMLNFENVDPDNESCFFTVEIPFYNN